MTWLKIKDVAILLNKTERAIQLNIKEYEYRHVKGKGRGGIQIEIALESLPQEAQDRYCGKKKEEQQSIYMSLTTGQRKDVDFKYNLVLKYKDFKETYAKADKMQAFLEAYNEEHPQKPLTKRQLNHWENKYDRDGVNGLVDRRGGYNKGQSSVPDDVWKVFLALYLKESKPTKEQCYQMVKAHFSDIEIPHISAFSRRLEDLGKDALILGREGKKAYEDKVLPSALTNYELLSSNYMWVADHHIFDVNVVDEDGKVFRPWLSGWIDHGSRFVTGYVINKISPNSDIVLDSFAKACHKCGIPDVVKLDNGKDYKVYDMFNTEFALSVANQMEIKVTNALPYNAKAKPIERLFKTFEEKYCKLLDSYVGNSPENRPEKMKKTNKKLANEVIPYKEFIAFVDDMIKTYNNTVHKGHGMNGKTPLERYKDSFDKPLRMVKNDDILNLFLMRTTKALTVGKNGIRIPEIGERYEDTKLFKYLSKKVYARYNSDNLKQVYVFTEKDEFICIAECKPFVDLGADVEVTKENIRQLNRKKKEVREFTKSQMAFGVKEPSIQDFVKDKASIAQDFDAEEQSQVIGISLQKHKHLKEIKAEEQRKEDAKKTSENSATQRSDREIDKALYKLIVGGQ